MGGEGVDVRCMVAHMYICMLLPSRTVVCWCLDIMNICDVTPGCHVGDPRVSCDPSVLSLDLMPERCDPGLTTCPVSSRLLQAGVGC